MNLFELKQEYQLVAQKLQDMDLDEQTIRDTLESMSGDLETKATNKMMVVKNMEAFAVAMKEAEAGIAARRKALEKRMAWMEMDVFSTMIATGITKIECPYFKLTIQDNPAAVDVFDEAQVPAEFIREVITTSVDKAALKEALKRGAEVPGAKLSVSQRLVCK